MAPPRFSPVDIGVDNLVHLATIIGMNYSLLRSRTFWSAVALFIVTGGNAIIPLLPANIAAFLGVVFLAMVSYFHLETAKLGGVRN